MMVEVKSIYFRHNEGSREILKDINFCAPQGSITAVLGPNGSGKSTLFRCIVGLWRPSRGEVFVGRKNTRELSFRERAQLFAMVPQDHHPPFPYKVFDVVLMGRASYVGMFSSPKKKDYEATEEAISLVGINHIRNKPYTKISGGERQLVLIARALAQASPVIILDEPTSHLDFRNQLKVLTTIRSISKERQITVLVTFHDPNLSMLFADYAVIINDGSVIATGPPHQIVTEELIKRVYGVETKILAWNGAKLVCPILSAK
ncbi:MAG: ABC transporter ATP-binding protein [Syntrophobacterales bacterium]|nr:ABC transporter ATP-binding protein [Syntrophobacterales bacterium]